MKDINIILQIILQLSIQQGKQSYVLSHLRLREFKKYTDIIEFFITLSLEKAMGKPTF